MAPKNRMNCYSKTRDEQLLHPLAEAVSHTPRLTSGQEFRLAEPSSLRAVWTHASLKLRKHRRSNKTESYGMYNRGTNVRRVKVKLGYALSRSVMTVGVLRTPEDVIPKQKYG